MTRRFYAFPYFSVICGDFFTYPRPPSPCALMPHVKKPTDAEPETPQVMYDRARYPKLVILRYLPCAGRPGMVKSARYVLHYNRH